MNAAKIAITLESKTLLQVDGLVREKKYPSRSRFIQDVLQEKIKRMERNRLEVECDNLDPKEEQSLAEEGMLMDMNQWPTY